MRNLWCCYKGESSNREEEVEERTQPVNDPSGSNNVGNDDFDEGHLFDHNEHLNLVWRNYYEHRNDQQEPQELSPNSQSISQFGVTFRWGEILEGTIDRRIDFLLGQGNFGSVYRCVFPSIDNVGAAKIQNLQNAEGPVEFAAEITTLHAANHPNVIKLLGKCLDRENRTIVYEYMPRGSLDRHIYADARPSVGVRLQYSVLDWGRRINIALGVAKALIYVHEELKTIHRDVKLSNVLLDEYFVPKLTDFGLATKIVENEDGVEQQMEISPIKGTRGCMAPETNEFGLVSSKSDVYSYGVFLFTLFTGRKAFDGERPVGTRNVTDWLSAVERRGEYRFPVEGLIRLFQAARMCTDPQVPAPARPNMRVVESMVSQAAACDVPEGPPVTRRSI